MKKITLLIFMSLLSFVGFSQTFPEGFEGASALPTGWLILDNGVGMGPSNTNLWLRSGPNSATSPPHTGQYAYSVERVNIGIGNTEEDWLITPPVTIPANGQLRFFAQQGRAGDQGSKLQVRISTGNDQSNMSSYTIMAADLTESQISSAAGTYAEQVINLAGLNLANQSVYIAFVRVYTQPTVAVGGDRFVIDDINLVQRCLDPTNGVANTITTTTASLSWTNPSGSANWEIEVVPSASPLTGVGTAITTNPYTAQNLTPGTVYQYRVRSKCTGGTTDVYSDWAGPFYFTTVSLGQTCAAPIVIGGLPYSTTDNTANYGNNITSSQGTTGCGTTTNYLTGNDVVYAYTATTTGIIDISMTPTATYSGIFVYNNCANIGTSCLAGVGNSNSNIRNITNFPVTAGTTYYFVISTNATPVSTGYTLVIQQINCLPPTALAVGALNMTSADLSWGNPSGATEWQVAVQLPGAGVPAGAGTTVTAMPYTATTTLAGAALTAGTAYEYYVRAKCPDGSFSQWSGPKPFQTPLCNNACNFNFIMRDTYGDGWNGNTISIKQNGVVIGTLTGPAAADGTNPVTAQIALCSGIPFEVYWNAGGSYPAEVGLTVVTPFGVTLYTKPPGTGSQDSLLYIGPTDCTPPTCPQPTALTTSNITMNSVQVSWTEAGTATAWEVIALPAGSPSPNTIPPTTGIVSVTTTPSTILTLTSDTAFDIYVRAVCSPTDSSYWTGAATIRTLPNYCGGDHFYDPGGASGDYGNSANVTTTICPAAAGQIVTVEFNSFDTEANYDFVRVYDGTGTAGTLLGTYTGNLTGANLPGPFESAPGSCLTFVFTSDGSGVRPGWDATVTCGPPPTCPKPTAFNTTNPTSSSVQLTWTETGTATSWEVMAVPAGTPSPNSNPVPSTAITAIVTSPPPYVLNGLDSDTNYDFYVRALCSTTDKSTWTGPRNSKTLPDYCGGDHFYDTGGATGDYANSANVTTTICPVNATDIVTIEFNTFNTEAGYDYLRVYEGTGTAGTLLGTFNGNLTGANLPGPFESAAPGGCITFVFTSDGSGVRPGWDATVTCGPPPTCPKPKNLAASNPTSNSVQLTWLEMGTATSWEVVAVPVGTPSPNTTPLPSTAITAIVNTPPPYTFGGLQPFTSYDFYVRALCSATDVSLWSLPVTFTTAIGNDNCSTAYTLPVNLTNECTQITAVSFFGSTASPEAGACGTANGGDIWFQFTATNSTHLIELLNFTGSPLPIVLTMYQGDVCGNLTQLYCSFNNSITATGLQPNTVYKIRATINSNSATQNVNFDICVKTPTPPANNNSSDCLINTVNADFELPDIVSTSIYPQMINHNTVLGWRTTASDQIMEFWNTPNYESVPAYSGTQFIELNANEVSGVYQDYLTPVTTQFTYGFAHRGRMGVDSCGLYAGPPGGPYTLVTSVSTDKTAWGYYTGNYTVPVGQTVTRFIFQSISSSGGNPSVGNFLDNINFTANNGIISPNPLNLSCTNNLANVSAAGVGTWSAHSSNPATTVIANPNLNNTTISGFTVGGTYKYDWTTLYCISTLEIVFDDNGNIQPTFTAVTPICPGATAPVLPLTSIEGITGTWNPAVVDNMATATYTFTPNAGQCATTATLTVTVNTGTTPTFTQIPPFCANITTGPPILPGTSLEGITGTWSPPLVSNVATGTYTFTPDAGQCAATTQMTVVVNQPVVPTFAAIPAICPNDPAPALPATSQEGIPGTWNPAVVDNTTTTTYMFTPASGNCAANGSLTITVNPGVQPTFAQIAPFCTNATVPVLPTTSLEGVTGTWSPAVVSGTATGTYTFTPTTGQCGSPATMTITVIPATQPTFTSVAAICPGDTAPVLPTTSLEGVTGTWSPAVVSNTATGTYTFTPTTGQCAQNATLTVTVQGAFTYEIFGDCIGNEFVLNVQNADGALDLSNAHFQWYNSTGAPVGNDNVSFNVTNYYTSSGTTPVLPAQFSVKVTTAAGCSLEKSYTVEQIYCQIQRGISPNGDGLNDTFDLTGFNVEKLGIFNRYGTEVFKHGAGYTNQWFGQSNGGNELPDGTYFYVIELKGSETKTGWIYINREK